MKSASAQKTRLLIKTRTALGFYPRSLIGRGRAFRPCAIGDPRGRAAVRASSGATARSILRRPPKWATGCSLLSLGPVLRAFQRARPACHARLGFDAAHGRLEAAPDRPLAANFGGVFPRSEERPVGKECRSRGSP